MNALFTFLASPAGRLTRVVAGLILIAIGIWAVVTTRGWGWVLIIVGLVPFLAGLADRCVFAPLAGMPFDGPGLRKALTKK